MSCAHEPAHQATPESWRVPPACRRVLHSAQQRMQRQRVAAQSTAQQRLPGAPRAAAALARDAGQRKRHARCTSKARIMKPYNSAAPARRAPSSSAAQARKPASAGSSAARGCAHSSARPAPSLCPARARSCTGTHDFQGPAEGTGAHGCCAPGCWHMTVASGAACVALLFPHQAGHMEAARYGESDTEKVIPTTASACMAQCLLDALHSSHVTREQVSVRAMERAGNRSLS